MRADMLVPLAELPGFDPVGLRVHGAEFPTSPFGLAVDASGDVVHVLEAITTVRHHARTLSVSLADAATRDRLARFVAQRVGLVPPHTNSGFTWHSPMGDGGWELGTWNRNYVAWFAATVPSYVRWNLDGRCTPWREVSALAGLDSTDRLPDGARRVDAEALAIVARHVAASVQP